jgi:hypothetical protein
MYRILLPFHNREDLTNLSGEKIDMPWRFSTQEGDVYHHAVVAFSIGLGISAESVTNFQSVNQFKTFLEKGGSLALSLDNWFVIEQTLGNNTDLVERSNGRAKIKIEGPNGLEYRRFESGRHVVSILGIEDGQFKCWDSFQLPQLSFEDCLLTLEADQIDSYLKYQLGGAQRGIALAQQKKLLTEVEPWINHQVKEMVPQEVVDEVRNFVKRQV